MWIEPLTFIIIVVSLTTVGILLGLMLRNRSLYASQTTIPYRFLVEAIQDGIWVMDLQGRTLYVNAPLSKLLRTTPEQMIGKPFYEPLAPDYEHITTELIAKCYQQASSGSEFELRLRDGSTVWVRFSAMSIYDEFRRVRGALVILTDISEQRKILHTVQAAEEQYRQIFENVSDIVFVANTDLVLQSVNPAFSTITGYPPEVWLGKPSGELMALDTDTLAHIRSDFLTAKSKVILDAPIRTIAGDVKTLQFQINPIIEKDNIVGFTGIARDVTQLRLQALQEFQTMLEHERLELLRDFVKNASHDLRNPLAIIASSAYLIRRKLTEDQLQRVLSHLNNIDAQVAHLTNQLNNVLTVSELHRIKSPAQYLPYSLTEIADKIIQEHHGAITHKQHQLTTHFPADMPMLMGSPDEIKRALTHLVVNAINYTPTNGEITVRISQPETQPTGKPRLCFSIIDTGIGISEDQQRYIFEPFFRVDNARGLDTGGMGLGLAIAKAIIEAHHGEIQVERQLGQGSTFRVYLPLPATGTNPRKSSQNILR